MGHKCNKSLLAAYQRRWLSPAAAGAAAICGGGLLAACASSCGGSQASPKASDVTALPATYQVVYRVETSHGSSSQQSWEVLTQSGPFDVSDLVYRSDPRLGADPNSGTVSSFDHLYELSGGRLTLVSDRQPGPGSGAPGAGVEVAELAQRRIAAIKGRSAAAGEPCTVVRFGEPPVGPITAPNGSGTDDICIDRSGLEAHEAWTYHGRVVLERTAVEVRVGSSDSAIHGAPALSTAQTSGAPAILKVTERPDQINAPQSYLATPPAPEGFTAQPVATTIAFSPSDPSQVTDLSTIWSFSDGGAVITVEAGQGQLPWSPGDTPSGALELKGLGRAALALRSDGPEVRIELDQNRWVRVRGTVPPLQLSRYASELALAGR